jgi:hypothetical protein
VSSRRWFASTARTASPSDVSPLAQQQEGAEPWQKSEYLTDHEGKPFDERKFLEAAEKQRHEERMEAADRENDKRRLDGILAKISEKGIDSLSRGDRKFLDEQSKKK